MASTSNISSQPHLEESAPSTSASAESSMPTYVRYKPPTTKLPFERNKRYHVFLSFRGKDVRMTLVDHLYQALSAAGLNVFLDSEKLKKGEMIDLTLEKAIESSAIRISIFSERYAGSAWCLKEAAAMLNSPGLIIPLFYHVEPTHVRFPLEESSPYRQSFLKHYGHTNRYAREDVDGWKKALHEICERSGWSTDITGGFEARLVKMVLNDLIGTLDRVPLKVAKQPVGLDSVKNAVIQKLNLTSRNEVVKVGMLGIGGIGKTTVAKAIYNQIYADFDATSFVCDVGTTAAEVTGLIQLQKNVLRDLCQNDIKVQSVAEGLTLFEDYLGGKRVLLILDDVVTVEQVNALVGDWLAPGSRVIITSKDEHILNHAEVECIQELNGLETKEGLQLFCWHAFLRASPTPNYKDISQRIVEACQGHPLSLEVIGSFLHDKQDEPVCWEEALDGIILAPKIHERLYISYRGLTDEEKEIFVDIACCFIGEHKKLPVLFWKSLQYDKVVSAIINLSMKLLIKIDDKGLFGMHDHLRDMGRSIAEKEKEGTRLWGPAHLSKIDFFPLRFSEGNPERLQMLYRHDLRYLYLQNVTIEDMTEVTLPPSLTCLRLEECAFASGKFRAIKKILAAIKKEGSSCQLRVMQLKGCSDLGSLPISSLFSLPYIRLLQHLDLEGCRRLDYLPESICQLSQLETLNLGWCEMLKELPSEIGSLSQLQHLDLTACDKLNSLPLSIGMLSKLRYLDLEMCFHLKNLPDTISGLSQLQHLNLAMCFNLKDLHHSIGDLSRLEQLDLKMCLNLNTLPETIGKLAGLKRLDLEGCASLNNLPGTIGELSQLQYFTKPPTAKTPTDKRVIQSYDVFLSFRGPDVRKSLVDVLFQALSEAGAYVFLYTESLKKGEPLPLTLERAIESSAIRIPIFSRGYADSVWCLKEAAAMLSTPGLIIPLFYHMNPSAVRNPESEYSPYRQSFLKHYGHSDRYRKEEIDGWKRALHDISSRSGWSVDVSEGPEAQQVKAMVTRLMEILKRFKEPSEEMDDAKNAVIQKLNLSLGDAVVKVVIWGMDSCIGQTTVVKAVYDQVCGDFEVAPSVLNVRATAADPRDLPNLQTQILKDLKNYDGKVQSVEQGKTLLRDHLAGKRVLLVLDGVDSVVQMDALVGNWLAPGSRVIITSTSKDILNVVRHSSVCIPVKDKFFVIGKS